MEESRPSYYAVIPADVRYDDRIPANAKLLYGEISALIGAEGYCYASNSYFCKIYGFSDSTITRLIGELVKYGYLFRECVRDNSGQISQRKLYLKASIPEIHPPLIFEGTPHQNKGEGTPKNEGENNLSNTKKKKDKRKSGEEKPEPLTDEQLRPIVVDAIQQIAKPDWTADVKNELFRWVMALYDPNRVVKKAHPVRSKLSVEGTFRKLAQCGNNPQMMITMLCTAVEGGWQGVQVPDKIKAAAPQEGAKEERQYRCL